MFHKFEHDNHAIVNVVKDPKNHCGFLVGYNHQSSLYSYAQTPGMRLFETIGSRTQQTGKTFVHHDFTYLHVMSSMSDY